MILYLLNLVLNKVLFLIHVYLFQYYRKWIFSPNHPCSREHFPHLSVTGNWIWEVCRSCRSWAVKQNGWNWTRLKEKKENCIHHSRFRQTEKSVHFVLFRQTKSTNCSHAMQRQDTEDVQKSTSKWDKYILQPSSAQQLNDILHKTWLCSMRYPLEVAFWKCCCSSWWRKV